MFIIAAINVCIEVEYAVVSSSTVKPTVVTKKSSVEKSSPVSRRQPAGI
jgi:hypothetical protein